MKLWLDAQLPPLLAEWINQQGFGVQASAVRELGLRDATTLRSFKKPAPSTQW